MPAVALALRAPLFHTPARRVLEHIPDALVEVDGAGTIIAVGPALPARVAELAAAGVLTTLPEGHYLLPGMVDLHAHAPQWPQAGRALDVPLEEWLMRHTFPLEARYADLVGSLLAHGTTTAVYFGTVDVAPTVLLAQTCLARGQRALVGKVAMDVPGECPDFYRDADADAALAGTAETIAAIRALPGNAGALVRPVITPRFLPTCSEALLRGLGDLAEATGAPVQTHCSESDWEVAHGAARFGCSDAAALERFGLLRAHTVLAHCTHLAAGDPALIRAAGAAIAHCPLSNVYFAGEVLPAAPLLAEGLRIGLGSDIAGGHAPSMLEAARFALTAGRVRTRGAMAGAPGVAEALWMATAGGAEALGLATGHFAPGLAFDAIALDALSPECLAWPGIDTPADVLEKLLRRAGLAQIRHVWVAGRRVAGG